MPSAAYDLGERGLRWQLRLQGGDDAFLVCPCPRRQDSDSFGVGFPPVAAPIPDSHPKRPRLCPRPSKRLPLAWAGAQVKLARETTYGLDAVNPKRQRTPTSSRRAGVGFPRRGRQLPSAQWQAWCKTRNQVMPKAA